MFLRRRLAYVWTAIAVLSLLCSGLIAVAPAVPVQAQGAHIIYDIYATDGYIFLADGTRMFIYGFIGGREGQTITYIDNAGIMQTSIGPLTTPSAGAAMTPQEAAFVGNAQSPGPVIYAAVGDVVEIRLKNLGVFNPYAPNDPHTIHLHGLDVDAANDGVPETSVAAVPANGPGPGAGNVVVYMFSAVNPGTYMYHCHQEASIHVTMGMYGALIIYNATDAARLTGPGMGANGGTLFGYTYTRDYVMLLTDTDILQHIQEETIGGPNPPAIPFNPVLTKPQYWFINGLSFPNTAHVDTVGAVVYSQWIQAHPGYEPLIMGSAGLGVPANADKVLVRVINLGFQTQPMHVHGFHPKIIGADQREWTWSNQAATGAGLEINTLLVGSGQTYELLFDFGQQQVDSYYSTDTAAVAPAHYLPSVFVGGTQSKYNSTTGAPVSNTDPAGLPIPDPFTPPFTYAGGPKVTGAVNEGAARSTTMQYFPWHNHDDYKSTNNGIYPGGQFTLVVMLP